MGSDPGRKGQGQTPAFPQGGTAPAANYRSRRRLPKFDGCGRRRRNSPSSRTDVLDLVDRLPAAVDEPLREAPDHEDPAALHDLAVLLADPVQA